MFILLISVSHLTTHTDIVISPTVTPTASSSEISTATKASSEMLTSKKTSSEISTATKSINEMSTATKASSEISTTIATSSNIKSTASKSSNEMSTAPKVSSEISTVIVEETREMSTASMASSEMSTTTKVSSAMSTAIVEESIKMSTPTKASSNISTNYISISTGALYGILTPMSTATKKSTEMSTATKASIDMSTPNMLVSQGSYASMMSSDRSDLMVNRTTTLTKASNYVSTSTIASHQHSIMSTDRSYPMLNDIKNGTMTCEVPAEVNNVILQNPKNIYNFHDMIRYKCEHGYKPEFGDFTWTCLGNLIWNGDRPSCTCR